MRTQEANRKEYKLTFVYNLFVKANLVESSDASRGRLKGKRNYKCGQQKKAIHFLKIDKKMQKRK